MEELSMEKIAALAVLVLCVAFLTGAVFISVPYPRKRLGALKLKMTGQKDSFLSAYGKDTWLNTLRTCSSLAVLAQRCAGMIWKNSVETDDEEETEKAAPFKNYTPQQIEILEAHIASLKQYAVLTACSSCKELQNEYTRFYVLLYFYLKQNCASYKLAEKIALGIHKYIENKDQIFGQNHEYVNLEELSVVFWKGILKENVSRFCIDDINTSTFPLSLAENYSKSYINTLSSLEIYYGITLNKPEISFITSENKKDAIKLSVSKQKFEDADQTAVSGHHFYPLISWIEDTPEYKTLYESLQGQFECTSCFFCGGDTNSCEFFTLSNGIALHKSCYNMLLQRLSELKNEDDARALFYSAPKLLSSFRFINTYWPDELPPDWETRCKDIFERSSLKCEDCSEDNDILAVQHIQPKSEGGNHSYDNLICVCTSCREKYIKEEQNAIETERKIPVL